MIRIVSIDIPDQLAQIADRYLELLRGELAALEERPPGHADSVVQESACLVLTNKAKVQSLRQRCLRSGREIFTRDVFQVAGVDEARFFVWQRGEYVSPKVARKCEEVVALPAGEFLRRLDIPVTLPYEPPLPSSKQFGPHLLYKKKQNSC